MAKQTFRKIIEDEDYLSRQFGRLMPDDFFRRKFNNYRQPFMNIRETNKEIIFDLEIPGVTKQDIEISVDSGGIEIKAEKKVEIDQEVEEEIFDRELRYLGFYEYVPLPEEADKDHVEANYAQGILELRVPKKNIVKKVHSIKVK